MIFAIIVAAILSLFSLIANNNLQPAERGKQIQIVATPPPISKWPLSFTPFDCNWVQIELESRNVKPDVVKFLMVIVERESQCCPFIQGGDRVDSNCYVTHVARWDHRSDTGLFMINGVHYKTFDGFVCPKYTCNQNVLRYDIDMQFDIMLELYEKCGKSPWTAPNYGCKPEWPYKS